MIKYILVLAMLLPSVNVFAAGAEDKRISFHEVKFELSNGKPCRLSMVLFHQSDFTLKVISNGVDMAEPSYRNLSEVSEQNGCVAVTNGGFFDINPFSPVGYTMIDGLLIAGRPNKPWMSGVVMMKGDQMLLGDIDELLNRKPAETALQSGPRLVKDGIPEKDLKDERLAYRTFIGRGDKGKWVMGIASACTLRDLSHFLVAPEMQDLIKLDYVLNLDGGPSSGLFFKGTDDQPSVLLGGTATVQNFLGLVPKNGEE
jgi:exopolysaccharide biosynthesis protein